MEGRDVKVQAVDYYEMHQLRWKSREFGMYQRGPFLDALVICALTQFFADVHRYESRVASDRAWRQHIADLDRHDAMACMP